MTKKCSGAMTPFWCFPTHMPPLITLCILKASPPYNTINVGGAWEGTTPIISFIISEWVDGRLAFLHGFLH